MTDKTYHSLKLLNKLAPAPEYDPLTGFGGLIMGPWVLETATKEDLDKAVRDYYDE